jgi:hypothetical protein
VNPTIPEAVRRFVHGHLPSMEHVDALLMLVASGSQPRSASEAAAELQGEPPAMLAIFRDLVKSGLAAQETSPDGEERFRYAPADDAVTAVVTQLVDVHRTRPVSLIRLVYDRPAPDVAKQFSDAFRIRKPRS